MKFLIDAQLPARLARFLNEAGHDALHTSELPDGNRTTDAQIAERADGDERIVVTKDQDFRGSHLLTRSPRRLLVVATGNITNVALLALFEAQPGCDSGRPQRGGLRRDQRPLPAAAPATRRAWPP